ELGSRCSLYTFFFHAEVGIRAFHVTGVQTCALPIFAAGACGLRLLELVVRDQPQDVVVDLACGGSRRTGGAGGRPRLDDPPVLENGRASCRDRGATAAAGAVVLASLVPPAPVRRDH